jgi:hypothetical protein
VTGRPVDAYVPEASSLMSFSLDEKALQRVRVEFLRIADIAQELLADPIANELEPLPKYRP